MDRGADIAEANSKFLVGGGLTFAGTSKAGIENQGTITSLGDVFLTAHPGAIVSNGGLVTLDAGRDVRLGTAGKFGDVASLNGSVKVTAGRDLILDEGTALLAMGGTLTAQATGDILIQRTAAPGAYLATDGQVIISC